MSDYNQEIISNDENKEDMGPVLTKAINKIIQDEGYISYTISVRHISTEGGNYLSLLKEVEIKGKTIENNRKETNLFIKGVLPETKENVMSSEEIFSKEVFIYTDVANLFNELQNEFNVPDNEKFNFVKYYHYGDNKFLIFDNMIKKGFKICNRFNVAPLQTIESSIKQLAKFHSLSMALKQYRPDFYEKKIQTLKYPLKFNESSENFNMMLCKISLEYLEGNRKIRVQKFLPRVFKRFYHYINENEGKVKCLCHGDYRMNNILVKEKNGEATAIIPIDFQTIFYCSPASDLIYAIFISTDRQFRKDHMENLKKIYFESLTTFLQYFNIDVNSVCPRKDFDDDFNNQLEYGLLIALFLLPFVLASEDDIPEVTKELTTIKQHENYRSRIEGLVDDFIEWGIL